MNTDIEVLVGDRSTGKTEALVNDVLSRSGVYTRVVLCPDGARRDVVTERLIMRVDRRWPVRWLMKHTGSASFADTEWGPIVVDQAIHLTILLLTSTYLLGA